MKVFTFLTVVQSGLYGNEISRNFNCTTEEGGEFDRTVTMTDACDYVCLTSCGEFWGPPECYDVEGMDHCYSQRVFYQVTFWTTTFSKNPAMYRC